MGKDPAFLFYYQDFLVGVDKFSNAAVGAYIKCLCHQAHEGCINIEHMKKICRDKKTFDAVISKFHKIDGNGNMMNDRLDIEVRKRKLYSKSRAENRASK